MESSIATQDQAPISIKELWTATETAWFKFSVMVFLFLESGSSRAVALHRARGKRARYEVALLIILARQCIRRLRERFNVPNLKILTIFIIIYCPVRLKQLSLD